ncbi:MAG: DNA replication and repair protein RecF [Patiriisocius sp.]|jgi:DNA replication and repair protein RecF
MHILKISLVNFRNFSAVDFSPHENLNVIYGDNGAGKSSLLEAIHVLGFGRSFRTSRPDLFISDKKTQAAGFCEFMNQGVLSKLGFSRSKRDGYLFSLNGEKTKKIVDIARLLPVQIFTPQSSDLILGPPLGRRRYLDWLLFHVEHQFQFLNTRYINCLNQRNALLKQFDYTQVSEFRKQDVWLNQLAELGESITALRESYISRLNREISALYLKFSPELNVVLRYTNGWEKSNSLKDSISNKVDRDVFKGATSSGPHKADLQFMVDHKNAAEFMSRGQLRLLVSLLLLAEVKLLKELTGKQSVFLIDDISAELDEPTREKFITTVLEQDTQVFVTAIEKQQMSFVQTYNNKKVFHVERNRVIEE